MTNDSLRDAYIPICQLHEDLVSLAGEGVAKKSLFKFGYSSGRRAAAACLESSADMREHDLELAISSSLASLGFNATAGAAHTPSNPSGPGGGSLSMSITLLNSPEAATHLACFRSFPSSACWFASGFASGFAQAFSKQDGPLFIEQECACNGGDECRLIGKACSEWKTEGVFEEIVWANELRYYPLSAFSKVHDNQQKMDVVADAIDGILRCQKAELPEALQHAVNILSEGFGCTVAIEEMGVVTYTCVHSNDKHGKNSGEFSLGGLALKASRAYSQAASYYLSKTSGFFLDDSVSGHVVHRLVTPIMSRHKTLGHLSMLRIDYPFLQTDIGLAETAARVISRGIDELRHLQLLDGKLKSSFVDNIITGSFDSSNPALNYGREIGFDFGKEGRALVVAIEDPEGQFPPTSRTLDTDFWIQVIVDIVRGSLPAPPGSVAVYRNKQIVVFLHNDAVDPEDGDMRKVCEHIHASLSLSYPRLSFTIGIGNVFSTLEECKLSFESAVKAIEVLKKTGSDKQICSINQFDARTLLYGSLDKEALRQFASVRLGPIIRHDRDYDTELFQTLKAYVGNRGNSHKTANDLSLSPSGLKYRLKAIEQLLGINVRDTSSFYDLVTALDIIEFIGADSL